MPEGLSTDAVKKRPDASGSGVTAPHGPGNRLKQWLNYLRRRHPEAEAAYMVLRTISDPALISQWIREQQPVTDATAPAMA